MLAGLFLAAGFLTSFAALGFVACVGVNQATTGVRNPYKAVRASFNAETGFPLGEGLERANVEFDEQTKTVSRRAVTATELTDQGIQVTSGLTAGEWIAIAGVHYLEEGQTVKLLGQ